jgi:hypothetical protein
MHLKSYQIDGKLLRTGAANFSASGLKRQDNDLVVALRRCASSLGTTARAALTVRASRPSKAKGVEFAADGGVKLKAKGKRK